MYSKYQLAFKWLQYYLLASNGKGHGIHSPFVYNLIREVFNDSRDYAAYFPIENIKKKLLRDNRSLQVMDFGAGSSTAVSKDKKISAIAKTALSDQKFGRLLFRLAHYFRANKILELGSSLGISTAYLASADASSQVITLEGSPAIASVAAETFQKLNLVNISQVTGSFDRVLPEVLRPDDWFDLVFIDGNHRKKPVLDYFDMLLDKMAESSLIIIHDIHWSREMEEAWTCIQDHPAVKLSMDIYSAGLVFFRKEFLVKQQFTIRL